MQQKLAVLLLSFAAAGCVAISGALGVEHAHATAAPANALDVSLRDKLIAMLEADQAARQVVVDLMKNDADPQSANVRRAHAAVNDVDEKNTQHLVQLIERHGWPTSARVGQEGANAAFIIAQHATHDPAFQKRYLEFLEQEYRTRGVAGQAVALLSDRIRLREGKPQRYGTQAVIRNGQLVFPGLEDRQAVDARRAEFGLPPLAEYEAMLREAYGLPPAAADGCGDCEDEDEQVQEKKGR